jgi:glycosyltransferase involved in cell wall biosynthesis
MRIAYATTFNARDVHQWSGTPYHMSQALEAAALNLHYVGPLQRQLPRFFKLKQIIKKYAMQQRESPRFNIHVAQHYSQQVAQQLKNISYDAVLAPLINPIAYLDTVKPIYLWTDAVYAALLGFYAPFSTHSFNTIQQGNAITQACLERCKKIFFSSQWAANSAIELYGIDTNKIHVVPFGANISAYPDEQQIKTIIEKRATDKIKLLFLAKSWQRKGGDKVLQIAKTLHENGHAVELTIIGYTAEQLNLTPVPPYLRCLGYISKHQSQGLQQIQNILAQTHFLIVPSQAEAYGIVFCEANAFAVPCLTTHVGGIGSIINDYVNGIKYANNASIEKYCHDIVSFSQDRKRYQAFAWQAYQTFIQQLNWQVAVKKVKSLILE